MDCHTLNYWDESQSEKRSLSVETEKVKDRRLNILSDQEEELISPNFGPISNGRLSTDTATSVLSGNLPVRNPSGSLINRRMTTVCLNVSNDSYSI